jgi:hypothetical protein
MSKEFYTDKEMDEWAKKSQPKAAPKLAPRLGLEPVFDAPQKPKAKASGPKDFYTDEEMASYAASVPSGDISKTESTLRGAAQGATFGFADELQGGALGALEAFKSGGATSFREAYEAQRDAARQKYQAAQMANPNFYMGGQFAGGVASSFVPGLAVARGASLASNVAKTGAQAALAGLGESEAKTASGMAVDALKSGAVGAAFPLAFKGAKEVAKAVIPGAKAGAANTVVANLSRVTGVSKEQAKAYKEMLDNPDKYKQAIEAADSFVKNADEYLIKAGNLDKKVRDAVSTAYGNLEKQAVRFNIKPENAEVFQKVSGDVTDGFNALLQQAADKDFYSSGTRKALTQASRIMVNATPDAKKLLQSGPPTPASMIKLKEMTAKAALEARRTIDDVLYKGGKKGSATLSMADEQILQEARDLAQKAVQTDLPGAASMKEADALFSAFKQKAESYLKQFSGKDNKPDINKLTGFLKGAGGQNQQAVREINEQRFMNYIQENSKKLGLSKSTVNELIDAAKPLRDAQDLARLGAQTGQSTGRSLMGIGLASGLGILGGPVGAVVGAATLPVTNPSGYLAAINQMRNVVAKIGEKKAGQLFGKAWPKVKQAIARTAATNMPSGGQE